MPTTEAEDDQRRSAQHSCSRSFRLHRKVTARLSALTRWACPRTRSRRVHRCSYRSPESDGANTLTTAINRRALLQHAQGGLGGAGTAGATCRTGRGAATADDALPSQVTDTSRPRATAELQMQPGDSEQVGRQGWRRRAATRTRARPRPCSYTRYVRPSTTEPTPRLGTSARRGPVGVHVHQLRGPGHADGSRRLHPPSPAPASTIIAGSARRRQRDRRRGAGRRCSTCSTATCATPTWTWTGCAPGTTSSPTTPVRPASAPGCRPPATTR